MNTPEFWMAMRSRMLLNGSRRFEWDDMVELATRIGRDLWEDRPLRYGKHALRAAEINMPRPTSSRDGCSIWMITDGIQPDRKGVLVTAVLIQQTVYGWTEHEEFNYDDK